MTVDTITIGAGTLALGETGTLTNLESQVTSCRLVPNVENGDPTNVLSGEQAPGDRSENFTLKGTILQDFGRDTTGGGTDITAWLYEHRGETMPFTFTPNTSRGKSVSGDVTVEAIEIGGDAKTKPTSDFEWQIVGAPTIDAGGAGFASLGTPKATASSSTSSTRADVDLGPLGSKATDK